MTLIAEHITHTTGGRTIVEDISCALKPGELSMILGPNGAGKSTLLRILAGQFRPGSGKISFDGTDLSHIDARIFSQRRAVLSQNISLSFPLSVAEVVLLGRAPHYSVKPGKADEDICMEAMDFFDVSELAQRQYLSLSGGEQQRVQFARVLAQIWQVSDSETRYLFLDEPLTFLDIAHQVDFMDKLKKLLQTWNLLVIAVVHDLNLAAAYADKILLLNNGKLYATGNPSVVLNPGNINQVYKVNAFIHHENGRQYILF